MQLFQINENKKVLQAKIKYLNKIIIFFAKEFLSLLQIHYLSISIESILQKITLEKFTLANELFSLHTKLKLEFKKSKIDIDNEILKMDKNQMKEVSLEFYFEEEYTLQEMKKFIKSLEFFLFDDTKKIKLNKYKKGSTIVTITVTLISIGALLKAISYIIKQTTFIISQSSNTLIEMKKFKKELLADNNKYMLSIYQKDNDDESFNQVISYLESNSIIYEGKCSVTVKEKK